jgi:hypothetical protein
MVEIVYLSDNDVRITNSEAKLGERSFKLADVKSASLVKKLPRHHFVYLSSLISLMSGTTLIALTVSTIVIARGNYAFLGGIANTLNALFFPLLIIGVATSIALSIVSVMMISALRNVLYIVRLDGTFGQVSAFTSSNESQARRIVDAIEAVVKSNASPRATET